MDKIYSVCFDVCIRFPSMPGNTLLSIWSLNWFDFAGTMQRKEKKDRIIFGQLFLNYIYNVLIYNNRTGVSIEYTFCQLIRVRFMERWEIRFNDSIHFLLQPLLTQKVCFWIHTNNPMSIFIKIFPYNHYRFESLP